MIEAPSNNLFSGARYFVEGVRLLWHPSLRLFILVPLAVNVVLFIALTAVLVHYFGQATDWALSFVPDWLEPLAWIAWLVLGILTLIIYGYSFNLITNFIAAPFYGLLAERAEEVLTGMPIAGEPLAKMIPRVIMRELSKLLYFFLRGFLVILLIILFATIPLVNFFVPALIGLAWGAWSMAIQYADYPADNHQTPFKKLRKKLRKKLFSSLGFGGMVMGCSIIPLLNIFSMPAAVTGGTIFWLNELRDCK